METISRYLLTFLLNSLWQIPLAAAVAALACRLMRNGPASHRHAVWVAALLAAIALPLASMRTSTRTDRLEFAAPQFDRSASGAPAVKPPVSTAARPAPDRSVSFARTTATVALAAYLLFVLFRLAWLAKASIRTIRIRQTAGAGTAPQLLADVWARCLAAFGLGKVELLCSAEVSGPVTAGRTIILPDGLLREASRDVLTTAIGHEMAHVARRDFASNLLYEVLYLPVSFHPASWIIHRNIERTREVACDELVTRRLMDAHVYARSIVTIAAGMTALPRPGYTLGVFDGDILEERIRRLMERRAGNLKRARLLLAAGLATLAMCAIGASTLALTARAQSTAADVMKEGEAAYSRGDYQSAAEHFRNAVKLEPSNIKAKLLLGHALLQQFNPGLDHQNDPRVVAARQQYLDVLSLDAANPQALKALMLLAVNTKQSAEARNWALKLIEADPKNTAAYYTAAFEDWVVAYPDYARARAAAGMKPQDPGIIPDAAARKSLREQHGARIEDGFRMLQIALQIDSGYSDAMAYMNLLYRIQAGIVDSPAESTDLIAKADAWVGRALLARKNAAKNPSSSTPSMMITLPPPPPPPPPPGWLATAAPPSRDRNQVENPHPYWQVAGSADVPARDLLAALQAKGFPVRLFASQDHQRIHVMVGPYPDQQALDQAKAALETGGFRAIRVW